VNTYSLVWFGSRPIPTAGNGSLLVFGLLRIPFAVLASGFLLLLLLVAPLLRVFAAAFFLLVIRWFGQCAYPCWWKR
jgi:hypothetical protein